MTGQSLLDRMELINQELQLQAGEENVVRGLVALNVAQDQFEAMLGMRKMHIGGTQTGTVTTSASTETTTWPTGVLRLDRLQVLDSNSRPKRELVPLNRVGGHAARTFWPLNILTSSTGEPQAYWENGVSIYWSPLPDATYTVRWYGLKVADDITAGGTFAYPDIVALPLAAFAVQLMKMGIDDPTQDVAGLSGQIFGPVLETLSKHNRDGAKGLEYTEMHLT